VKNSLEDFLKCGSADEEFSPFCVSKNVQFFICIYFVEKLIY